MEMNKETPNSSFSVQVYTDLKPFNSVLSKARVRIFYKGLNRNRTYITDEFAEKLLSTISYTPVCGIWDEDSDDFEDHGEKRSIAKAYGVVPENPNITWETHLDEDGVEREYACADVILWTARYEEANKVVGKSQSMELYDKSIKGEWKFDKGIKYFEFSDGCFIGLTPLGDDVEPCFEGSAFYTLATSLSEMVNELKNYTQIEEGGHEEMVINFKISDNAKYRAIWDYLNPNFTEEGEWAVEYGVNEIYDDYALVYNYETGESSRLYYTKNDEDDTITFGDMVKCFIVDVTEAEYTSLKTIQALNNNTYENIDGYVQSQIDTAAELQATVEQCNETISGNETTIGELNTQIETLNSEKETLVNNIAAVEAERDALSAYKAEVVTAEKKAIIKKYEAKLGEEVIKEFSTKIDEYSVENLEKDLAFALVNATPALFSNNDDSYIYTGVNGGETLSPAARLLKKYRDKSN